MSIYGRRKTALSSSGILGRRQGFEALHLMINLEFSLQIAGSFQGDISELPVQIPPSQIAQQGDGDITVVITVIDGNTGLPVDLSPATDLTISFKKPDLFGAARTAVLSTNGRDGKMQIALGPTDLAQVGYYFVQANFVIMAVGKSTEQGIFVVGETIIPPLPENTEFEEIP
jgi:hypothetical protein